MVSPASLLTGKSLQPALVPVSQQVFPSRVLADTSQKCAREHAVRRDGRGTELVLLP